MLYDSAIVKFSVLLIVITLSCTLLASASDDVQYQIGKPYYASHIGEVKPSDSAVYLCVPLVAKNTTAKTVFVGGMFSVSFQIQQKDFKYDVDSGVAFSNSGYFSGAMELKPLLPQKTIVVFTVPQELKGGSWTMLFPGGETHELAVN
jgi:hypothetical protein